MPTSRSDTVVESIVKMPVLNPEGKGVSRTFTFAGRVDRVENGKLIDWKSCDDPDKFIRERVMSFQVELYALALRHAGINITEVEYRLVRKPNIRLCGKDVDEQAYEDRCYAWILSQRDGLTPYTLFVSEGRLKQARSYLWECSKRILDSRQNQRWIPNALACHDWSRTCEYATLCDAEAKLLDVDYLIDDFYEKSEPHPELGGAADESVLTHSRLTCLSQCEVKHFWRYERCIRRQHEYSEALWLGSAMHVGLERYAVGGLEAAKKAVDEWQKANPIIGPDQAHQQAQQAAKARAMVRAAAKKWPMETKNKETNNGDEKGV